ncbi:iron ABC transporter permease [Rhizobium sp. L51/94]|uniref:FecCD family ABC transporter permease n=1 Tax=Rhizobium sp. L51/94 TaxID=2819999 RepID=UPI001C5B6742|nr:iron ABC transporter permease [Rhizobium sp. L51/94]QXZ81862.1 iron ABC transporter permease [Rhizobium sp. L51/94]
MSSDTRRQPSSGIRVGLVTGALLLAILTLACIHISIGARAVSPLTLFQAVFHFDPANFDHQLLVKLRFARLAAALLVGAALGVSGLLLQGLLHNPLGEPHILGLNAGAALAVTATSSVPFLSGGLSRPLIASVGAATLFILVLAVSSAGRSGPTMLKVTFCGIALSSLASSITSAILLFDEETLQSLRFWLAGDLAGVSYGTIAAALGPIAVGLLLAFFIGPRLNALALGVPIWTTRFVGLCATAILAGTAVSIAGPIGFVGLIVPAIARWSAGGDARIALPLAALLGAALLVAADIGARTLFTPYELATGIMTAMLGAPLFVAIASRALK